VIRAAMNSISNALVTENACAMIAWLDAQEGEAHHHCCVGHCMSGCYITTVAAPFPHRIKAAASLYRMHIVTDKSDSSRKLIGHVQRRLYYAFAEHNQSVPVHVIPDLKRALAATDVANTVAIFQATRRGFCFSEQVVHDPVASEHTCADIIDVVVPRDRVTRRLRSVMRSEPG
jgi:carboxymethylenebutenolidase